MAMAAIPTGPRAMARQEGGESALSLEDQILESAATEMYPKLVLLEALAGFKGDHKERKPSNDRICEARRDFLDCFAYLCDVEKGGPTVTATALQKLPHSNILWIAANEGVRNGVKIYADNILQRLRRVEPGNQTEVQDDILRLAAENCSSRIEHYKGLMQKHATKCRMQLRHGTRGEIGAVW